MDADTVKAVKLLEFLASGLRTGVVELHALESKEVYADTVGLKSDGLFGELTFSWLRPAPLLSKSPTLEARQ